MARSNTVTALLKSSVLKSRWLRFSLASLLALSAHAYTSPKATAETPLDESTTDSEVVINYDDPNMAMTNAYVSEAVTECLPNDGSPNNDASENLDACVAKYQQSKRVNRGPAGPLGYPIDLAKVVPKEVLDSASEAHQPSTSSPLRPPAKSIKK